MELHTLLERDVECGVVRVTRASHVLELPRLCKSWYVGTGQVPGDQGLVYHARRPIHRTRFRRVHRLNIGAHSDNEDLTLIRIEQTCGPCAGYCGYHQYDHDYDCPQRIAFRSSWRAGRLRYLTLWLLLRTPHLLPSFETRYRIHTRNVSTRSVSSGGPLLFLRAPRLWLSVYKGIPAAENLSRCADCWTLTLRLCQYSQRAKKKPSEPETEQPKHYVKAWAS